MIGAPLLYTSTGLVAPQFAEAYNQRAILYFQMKDYARSIADCEKVLVG